MVFCYVSAEVQRDFHIFDRIGLHIRTEVRLAIVMTLDDTVLAEITAAYEVSYLLVTAVYGHTVLLHSGGAIERCGPVSVLESVVRVTVRSHIYLLLSEVRLITVENASEVVVLHILGTVHHLRKGRSARKGHTSTIINGSLAFGTALRGDENNTRTTVHTIYGTGSGVFQDRNGCDVVSIDTSHRTLHSVYQHERLGTLIR